MGENKLRLSCLGHTWILDLDGTVVKHNGYKTDGEDSFLEGAEAFLKSLPEKDMVVFLTSRTETFKEKTERFLAKNGIRYDHIIYGVPYGERILVNDRKPTGLKMSYSVCSKRDEWAKLVVEEDENI